MPKFISNSDEIVECARCGSTEFEKDFQTDKQMFVYCVPCDKAGADLKRNYIILDLRDDK